MTNTLSPSQNVKFIKSYLWIIVVSLLYVWFSFTAPIDADSAAAFGLSTIQLRLVQVTIILPIVGSWIIGVIGYNQLLRFGNTTPFADQQTAFKRIAVGIMLLVSSSILPAFLNIIRNRLENTVSDIGVITTIISNYMDVFLPLVGLALIFVAIKSLAQSVNAPKLSFGKLTVAGVLVIALSVLNVWLVFTNDARQVATTVGGQATYYVSDSIIILTLLIPTIITWCIGIIGVMYSFHYQRFAVGIVFKTAIARFTWGLIFVLVATIMLQLLQSLGGTRLLAIGTEGILGIIYLFIILQTVGYLCIALGSKKFTVVEKILAKYS